MANLMLVLNRSLLNREYILINVLFDHFNVQTPCNFLIGDYTEILYTIYKWNVWTRENNCGIVVV
jgi:hypothetical protein